MGTTGSAAAGSAGAASAKSKLAALLHSAMAKAGKSKLANILHAGATASQGTTPSLFKLISDTPAFLATYAATHGAWVYGLLFCVVFAEVRR